MFDMGPGTQAPGGQAAATQSSEGIVPAGQPVATQAPPQPTQSRTPVGIGSPGEGCSDENPLFFAGASAKELEAWFVWVMHL